MFVIISFIVLFSLSSAASDESNITKETPNILESWIKLDNTLKGTAQSAIKYLMPIFLETSGQVNLSSTCIKQGLQVVTGIRSLKKWAFSFVDSSAKSLDGIMSGMLTSFGEYDQCLETLVKNSRKKDEVMFQGQYCLVHLRFPLPPKTKKYRLFDHLEELRNFKGSEVMKDLSSHFHSMYYVPIKVGLCIPSGCSEDDLQNILTYAVKKVDMDAQVAHCEIKEEKTFHWIQIFAIFVISCLAFLVIIGTWMEMHTDSKDTNSQKTCHRILLSFSSISNFKRLFNTETSMETFSCLHGIRFLTITWVVYGHTYLMPGTFLSAYRSLFRVADVATEPMAQMVINSSECVDTFLFIGGMLLSYMTIKRVKLEKKKFNYIAFVLHRYWRIAPVLYFILLCGFLIPLMGSGPNFQEIMDNSVYPCFTQWWRNMFFVNNFFDSNKACWLTTWYVSCDFQLYLISVIVVLPMIWFKKIGLMINTLIIAASIIYSGIITYLYDVAPTIIVTHMNPEDEYHIFIYTYANLLSRAGPYFVGVFTGYLLISKADIKISKKVQIIGWCLAALSIGMVVFAPAIWYRGHQPTQFETVLYAATYKVAFSASIAWMTFCCATGYGGFINTFLSWKVWMPLGRLAFLTYLIQPVVQMSYMSNFRTAQEFSHLQFGMQFFGFLCISMLLAFVSNLLVESPFLNLQKLLFEATPGRIEKQEMNDHTNLGFENGNITTKENGHLEMVTSENDKAEIENYKNNLNEKSDL